MPLILAPLNQQLKIVKVIADEKLKKHLESLGIVANGCVTVISQIGGNVICVVKEGRLALDRNVASKIFVA